MKVTTLQTNHKHKQGRSQMGSRKPFPELGDYVVKGSDAKICILINAVYYFLESVFVVISEDHCRLVVIHSGKLIVDQCYDTLRGAKIAFYRMYKEKGCVSNMHNEWSANYEPESHWLKGRLNSMPHPIFQEHIITPETRYAESY